MSAPIKCLVWALGLAFLVAFAWHHAYEGGDAGWHYRNGADIVAQRGLPRSNRCSFNGRGESPLVQEWLGDIVYYVAAVSAGRRAVLLLVAAAGALGLLLAAGSGRVRTPWATVLAALLGALVVARGFRVGNEVFTWPLVAIEVRLIDRLRCGARWPLAVLPALVALWANLHSSFILALAILALTLAGESIALLAGDPTARERLKLVALGLVLAALAALANPYGASLYRDALGRAASSEAAHIDVFRPPSFSNPDSWPAIAALAATLGLLLLGPARFHAARLLPIVGLVFLTLTGWRYATYLTLVALPLVTEAMAGVADFIAPKKKRLASIALAAALAVGSVAYAATPRTHAHESNDLEALSVYLRAAGLTGNLYNAYDQGGYLVWRHCEDHPVFWDGRNNLYEASGVFHDGLVIASAVPPWRQTLAIYEIEIITTHVYGDRLYDALGDDEAWVETYVHGDVSLWLRRGSANAARAAARREPVVLD